MDKNFLLDNWPYLLLLMLGFLLLNHTGDLPIGFQNSMNYRPDRQGLFQLDVDAQRILGALAVLIAVYKIWQGRARD